MQTTPEALAQAPAVDGGFAVNVDSVTRAFPARRRAASVTALDGLPLRAKAGSVVAVVGPSGCGKSTLLELICALQHPDAGSVRSAPAVLMAQRDLLLPWLNAVDNAALPLRIAGESREHARERARPLFDELGLNGFADSRPDELSGGMRQRVAFLRTLLSGKPVLALDEPFASLDALTRSEVQDWLLDALARQPRTVVLVTHDVEEAVVVADRVVVMSPRPGRVVAQLDVTLPRPRSRTSVEVGQLREQALKALGSGARSATVDAA